MKSRQTLVSCVHGPAAVANEVVALGRESPCSCCKYWGNPSSLRGELKLRLLPPFFPRQVRGHGTRAFSNQRVSLGGPSLTCAAPKQTLRLLGFAGLLCTHRGRKGGFKGKSRSSPADQKDGLVRFNKVGGRGRVPRHAFGAIFGAQGATLKPCRFAFRRGQPAAARGFCW